MTAPDAPAPTKSYIPLLTDLTRLGRVLFTPTAVFEEQKDHPTFWMPWIVVSVIWMALALLQRPFQNRIRDVVLARMNRPVPAPSAVGNIVSMIGGPIAVLLMCLIGAAILYALVSVLGGETGYKKMLNVVVFSLPVVLIIQAATVFILHTRGLASINGPEDMIVSFGLDLLLPQSAQPGYFLRFVLMGIGPLQIWGLAITATGLGVMGKLGKGGAWTAAIINFLIVLLLTAGLGAFGMKMAAG